MKAFTRLSLNKEKSKRNGCDDMTNYYEERLREIEAMLHLEVVQETTWMKTQLEAERKQILSQLQEAQP